MLVSFEPPRLLIDGKGIHDRSSLIKAFCCIRKLQSKKTRNCLLDGSHGSGSLVVGCGLPSGFETDEPTAQLVPLIG
ncbi:MAG: hypothetical protein FJ308_20820 [Planctomycetes bacterium]|nr:hypothetical protein [Planctomycetota bacterium]